jgi:hypothetical protein
MTCLVVLGTIAAPASTSVAATEQGSSNSTTTTFPINVPNQKPFPVVGLQLSVVEREARAHHMAVDYIIRVPTPAAAGVVVDAGPNYPYQLQLEVSTGPNPSTDAVLPGASGPPVVSECDETLGLGEDGTAGPTLCSGNRINIAAWDYYLRGGFPLMSLPQASSECEIFDRIAPSYLTSPTASDELTLAETYYGWHLPKSVYESAFGLSSAPPPCPAATTVIPVSAVTTTGSLASPYVVTRVVAGRCAADAAITSGANYTCTSGRADFSACWSGISASGHRVAYCMSDPQQLTITEMTVRGLPTVKRSHKHLLPWVIESEFFGDCARVTSSVPPHWDCYGDETLGSLNTSATPWTVKVVRGDRELAPEVPQAGATVKVTAAWTGTAFSSSPSTEHLAPETIYG